MDLDSRTSALVAIDLQNGVLGRDTKPRPATEVLASAKALAARFREAGALVVWVRVSWAANLGDAPRQPVDQPMPLPPGGLPAGFDEFPDGLVQPSDLVVTKRQWGAFYGTDLDLQLRRRGIRTIVLGGIATNFGVESTARDAWERGYSIVIAEDITASLSVEMHEFSLCHILPRLARISSGPALAFAER
ncbi:MAG: hydrolase [Isosphaeraceae bacterium]